MRSLHSKAEILHRQQTFTSFQTAVESQKLAVAQVLSSHRESLDDLIQTMESLKLEVNNSRRATEEKESKLSGEREAKTESLIAEYFAAEEEIEELKSLCEEMKLTNETGEELLKALTEEKELRGNLESRAKELEELKREVQEQETESQAARRELEGKTEERRQRLQTIRRRKSQMAVKLAETEAATLRKKQELARLSGLADLDKVQLREEQEKERKVKENCQKLAEMIKIEAEKKPSVKEEPNHSISEPSKDDIKPLEVAVEEFDEEAVNKMRQEVRQAREMVRRATRHKEMLRELYEERNKNNKHADKSFAELRGEYIR